MSQYTKAFDLFIDEKILSLRKYETKGFEIFEFKTEDWDKIKDSNYISNIPSIYILENGNDFYIGETENFSIRIKDHFKNKEFDKVYVISSNILNKNICLEIESETIQKFKNSVQNYNVINQNENNNSFLNPSDKLKFKEHWKTFEEIYFLLQFNINPKKIEKEINDDSEIFQLRDAKMKIVDGGYLLIEGSKIFIGECKLKNIGLKVINLKEKLIKEEKVSKEGILQENIFDIYPSPLGALVTGRSSNGYSDWKNINNKKSLGDYLDR